MVLRMPSKVVVVVVVAAVVEEAPRVPNRNEAGQFGLACLGRTERQTRRQIHRKTDGRTDRQATRTEEQVAAPASLSSMIAKIRSGRISRASPLLVVELR